MDLAYLKLAVNGRVIAGTLDVPAAQLASAMPLDANHDGRLEVSDIAADATTLGSFLLSNLRLFSGGRRCVGASIGAFVDASGLVAIRARWRCAGAVQAVAIRSTLAHTLGVGQSTFVRATEGGRSAEALLSSDTPSATLDFAAAGRLGLIGRFVWLGMTHIYTGADHVLFLLTLLMLGGSLRRILGIATAFTVAHSITLSLTALGVVTHLSSRMVESAIALSIAYVALENFLVARRSTASVEPRVLRWRWLVSFGFGLVHGFGFASALRLIGLPAAHLPLALFSFNAGVELGQATIIVAAWPLIAKATRTRWYVPAGVRFASVGVFGVAMAWFVARAW